MRQPDPGGGLSAEAVRAAMAELESPNRSYLARGRMIGKTSEFQRLVDQAVFAGEHVHTWRDGELRCVLGRCDSWPINTGPVTRHGCASSMPSKRTAPTAARTGTASTSTSSTAMGTGKSSDPRPAQTIYPVGPQPFRRGRLEGGCYGASFGRVHVRSSCRCKG